MESSLVAAETARCGAKTRSGRPCRSLPVRGRSRCRMHGGSSTGPKTPEGRRRVGEATRKRYVEAALEDGWVILGPEARAAVLGLLASLGNSRNATAKALGLTAHGLRRVLVGLPSRPEEADAVNLELGRRGMPPHDSRGWP